jgi:hypothetical protein
MTTTLTFNPETSINKLEAGHYWFECAMISRCSPVFDRCDDNHDVEDLLRKQKVILPTNQTDSESCALVVNFSSQKAGEAFVNRLNKYLLIKLPDNPNECRV